MERYGQDHRAYYPQRGRSVVFGRAGICYGAAPGTHRKKNTALPFAKRGLTESLRDIKMTDEFTDKREEILTMIWEMEEDIMGRQEQA